MLDVGSFVDPWSIGHALFGVVAALRGMTRAQLLAVAWAWEWFEATETGLNVGDPSPLNSLGDILAAVAAHHLARRPQRD